MVVVVQVGVGFVGWVLDWVGDVGVVCVGVGGLVGGLLSGFCDWFCWGYVHIRLPYC